MADVPDHLAPRDGLSDAVLKYRGFDTHDTGGGAMHRFDIYDEAHNFVGTYEIDVRPTGNGTADGNIAEAHRKMINTLRQWIYETELVRQAYEASAKRHNAP